MTVYFSKRVQSPPYDVNVSDSLKAGDLLRQIEDGEALVLLPALIFIGLLAIAGSLGNTLALVVYYKRFRPSSTRTYILTMSVFDLLFNVVSIPGEILDMRFSKTFDNRWLCRMLRFSNVFLTLVSGFILVAVALDRRKKICLPLQHQLSPKEVKKSVIWCTAVAFVIAVPFVVLNGRHSVDTGVPGIKGSACSVDDRYITTPFALIYNVLLALVFFACVGTMATAYVTIATKIVRHKRQSAAFGNTAPLGLRARFESAGVSEGSVSSRSARSPLPVEARPDVSSGHDDDEVFSRRTSVSSAYGETHVPPPARKVSWGKFKRRNKAKKRCHSDSKGAPSKPAHAEESVESSTDTRPQELAQKSEQDTAINGGSSHSPLSRAKSCKVYSEAQRNRLYDAAALAHCVSEEIIRLNLSSKGSLYRQADRIRSASEGDEPVDFKITSAENYDVISTRQPQPLHQEKVPETTQNVKGTVLETGKTSDEQLDCSENKSCAESRLPASQAVSSDACETASHEQMSSKKSLPTSPSDSKADTLARFGAFVNGSLRRLRSFGHDDVQLNESTRSVPLRRRHTRKKIPARTTWMMFVLTAIFIFSYLPYLAITCVRAVHRKIEVDLIGWQLNLYTIAHRSYFINSVINPIVYSFCSARFRQQCRRMFSRSDVISISDKS